MKIDRTRSRIGFLLFVCALLVCALFACGTTENKVADEPHEHDYANWRVTIEPTTEEMGEVEISCACGKTERFSIPVLSESSYDVTVEEPTCAKDGKTLYACAYGTFTTTQPALGHRYERNEEKSVPATCTAGGKDVYECARCHDTYEEETDEVAHTFVEIGHTEGSCATDGAAGETRYECSVCHTTMTIPYKKAHDFDEGVYTAVDCPTVGFTTYTCRDCGEKKVVYDEEATHRYGEDGVCAVCGQTCAHVFDGDVCTKCGLSITARVRAVGYFHWDANGNGAVDVGEKVYYGFYPTSIVGKDTETFAALEEAEPTDGTYEIGGERYVKIDVDQVRGAFNVFSDGKYISSYKQAYFRYEPVRWTAVDVGEDGVTLFSDRILDVTDFRAEGTFGYDATRKEYYVRTEEGFGDAYADDWATADVRAFLNGAFYEALTDETQRALATESTLDNDESNYYKTKVFAHGGETTDVVYLPAYGDLFGEEDAYDEPSDARRKTSTDYAKARGLSLERYRQNGGTSPYYLRSVGNQSKYASCIDGTGAFVSDPVYLYNEKTNGKTQNGIGIAPMIKLRLP